jgi:hypothetical protein
MEKQRLAIASALFLTSPPKLPSPKAPKGLADGLRRLNRGVRQWDPGWRNGDHRSLLEADDHRQEHAATVQACWKRQISAT